MKERIIRLMSSKKLTAIRFAEIMGVRPSSISHIMSGRNNPSYDFILKVLENFPDVSPDWFILGKGNMYRMNDRMQSDVPLVEKINTNDIVPLEEEEMAFNSDFEVDIKDSHLENEPQFILPESGKDFTLKRNLQRVVLLYNDGTFESYDPTK